MSKTKSITFIITGFLLFLPVLLLAETIQLPQTGQTKCYDAAGAEIDCADTGQDGEIRAGVAWPDPRFVNNGDGTITDKLTGLIWAKDAGTPTVGQCPGGKKTWQEALDYVTCLNFNNYLGHSDWLLPNINELESLVNAGEQNPAVWLNVQKFENVQSDYYFSSTGPSDSGGWFIGMWDGLALIFSKDNGCYVWPLRAEQYLPAPSKVWKTGQSISYSSGDDGSLQRGVAWPYPRFTVNGDGTVTDNLTGLIWARDAGAPTIEGCSGGMMGWQQAFDYVACLNAKNYLNHNDWRIPNRKELFSLIDHSQYNPALVSGYPFINVQDSWSSTTVVFNARYVWLNSSWYGYMVDVLKDFWMNSVWPVRGGQVGGTFKLPDTGQTTCYDGAGTVITCPAPGEPLAQDGSYNINFLSYTDNGNGTVTDNNTGLMWQKQDDGALRTWDVAGSYCASLGTGWRLPTKKELISIVNFGAYNPSIDTTYFLATKSMGYWSSTTGPYAPAGAWVIDFKAGAVDYYGPDNGLYVRCTKGGEYPAQNLVDNGNGTVTDNAAGLIWQQGENESMSWDTALSFCNGLSLGGYSDWRLPNIKELESLTSETRNNPAIDTSFFAQATASAYLSSTTYMPEGSHWDMYYVNFNGGSVNTYGKSYSYNVRCVRGGGSTPPPPSACIYTYSNWGDCQPDNTQTRTVLASSPAGCVGTPVTSQSCTYVPPQGNLEVSPSSHDFGELFVGDCDLQLFTVKNTGNADLNVSGISLSDTTNYDFDKTIIYACATDGQTITSGDSCNVVVKFCPSTSGTSNANLAVTSNDPDTPTFNVPLTGSAKKLCDPPGTVYAKNDNAYGLFEGTVHDVNTDDITTAVIDIQGTDLIDLPFLKPWRLELWVSIDKITFDSSVVTAVEPNGNGSDDLGAFFAAEHVIAPGTHASFQANFCKPGTITFELGHSTKAQLLTAADFYLSVFGTFTPDQVFKFADAIDNIPLVASSLKHISNAFDAAANKKLGKSREELTLAAEDVRKIASNKRQFNQLLNADVDLGLNIGAKKLVSALLKGIPFKMIKVFGDAIVYNIKTGLGTKPIQIIVIAN